MQNRPVEGVHYPGSLADIRAWFPDDEACLDYLDWLRWREGFVCPHCQDVVAWRLPDGRHSCGGCGRRVSVTAGTIFHRTRTPLTVWFEAAWLLTSQKSGASALGLQRVLSLGSYQTAWTMLHRFRRAMVTPGRNKLSPVSRTSSVSQRALRRGRGRRDVRRWQEQAWQAWAGCGREGHRRCSRRAQHRRPGLRQSTPGSHPGRFGGHAA